MAGIRRTLGARSAKKAPILLAELRAMVAACDTGGLQGKRDRALLLVGWAGAFRRSELVALDVGDLSFSGGVKLTLRRSKTDQEGAGMVKVIPSIEELELDPVRALRAWIEAAGIRSGPVFRRVDRWGRVASGRLTGRAVAIVVKRLAQQAGLDPRGFSGHSLRSGFTTAAASAGVESRDIMAQTGHRSEAVMRGYIQDAGLGASVAVRAAFGFAY
jgi:integrase